jgi:hypothetical protein
MRHRRGLDGLFSLDIDDAHLGITAAALAPLVDLWHLGALGVDAKDDWRPYVAQVPHLSADRDCLQGRPVEFGQGVRLADLVSP